MDTHEGRIFHNVTLNDMDRIRSFVRETAVAHGYDQAAIDELITAVNEATVNIVKHGYQNEPGYIEVIVVCRKKEIVVRLRDESPGFDPTTAPSPDTALPLSQRPFGGLGVHMMRTFCDDLSYRRDSRGENELTLTKRISQ
jgi:serine/threonine-protein kinase RsbW